ncbi:MAG: hypothetical protein HFH91_03665 [Lachnospiraceae bacterium]|nr:hypothetical protein [Lachnospiraceae bacterium]
MCPKDMKGAVGKCCQSIIYGCKFQYTAAYIAEAWPFPDSSFRASYIIASHGMHVKKIWEESPMNYFMDLAVHCEKSVKNPVEKPIPDRRKCDILG